MAVVVRLKRTGAPNKPKYRMVATEKTKGPRGKEIEILGNYDPKIELKDSNFKLDRIKYWISKGAKLSDRAFSIYKKISKNKEAQIENKLNDIPAAEVPTNNDKN